MKCKSSYFKCQSVFELQFNALLFYTLEDKDT